MAVKLSVKQAKFASMVGRLIAFVDTLPGYSVTFGDAYRDLRATFPYQKKPRLHSKRLAVDFNLFIEGEYQSSVTAHTPLGLFWESIGGTWGGRFKDANHYSLAHGGMK